MIAKIDRTIANRSFSPLTSSELVARGFFENSFIVVSGYKEQKVMPQYITKKIHKKFTK